MPTRIITVPPSDILRSMMRTQLPSARWTSAASRGRRTRSSRSATCASSRSGGTRLMPVEARARTSVSKLVPTLSLSPIAA